MALSAAGYSVYAINPRQVSRYRERHGTSGAKSDRAGARTMAGMVRTGSRQLRPVAGDSAEAEAIKVAARADQTLVWERIGQVQRLPHQLREYFPAAPEAFEDLDAPDALELLAKAPDPARAARLTRAQVAAALKRARRRDIAGQDRRHPGRAARRAAVPAAAGRRRLRCRRQLPDGDHRSPQRRDRQDGTAGDGVLSPPPGRRHLPEPARYRRDPGCAGAGRVR